MDLSDSKGPSLPPRKPLNTWSVEDVCKWVEELGMSQYAENFRQNAIDGTEVTSLTNDSLEKALGIGNYINYIIILQLIL